MKFLNLTAQNFLSISKAEVRLDRPGLTLVLGKNLDSESSPSNGAGKSSLFDALCWGLFGKTSREATGDAVVNRFAGSDCRVAVSCLTDKGEEFLIVRHRKSKQHGNLVALIQKTKSESSSQAESLTGMTNSITDKKIQDLVGMDFGTFTSSVMFGQLTARFAQATDKERKAVLEKLLNMEVFEGALRLVRADLADKKDELVLCKSTHDNCQVRTRETLTKIQEASQMAEEEEKERKAKIEELERQLEEHSAQNREMERKCGEVYSEIEQLSEKAKERDKAMRLTNEIANRRSSIQNECVRYEMSLQSHLDSAKRAEAEFKELESKPPAKRVCKTCGQSLPVEGHERIANRLLGEAEEGYSRASEFQAKLTASREQVKVFDDQLNLFRERLEEASKSLEGYDQKIQLHSKLARQAEQLRGSIRLAAQSLKDLGTKTGSYDALLESLSQDLTRLKGEAKVSEQKLGQLEREVYSLSFWENGFSTKGMRSYLLESVVPFLQNRANHYCSRLTDGAVKLTFSITKSLKSGDLQERLDIKAINQFGADEYKSNSSGERQRIDLAIALALADIAASKSRGSVNIAVYDEVFEHLDEGGCERVVDLFREELGKDKEKAVFVITHIEEMKQLFPNVLCIVKKDGLSTVELS